MQTIYSIDIGATIAASPVFQDCGLPESSFVLRSCRKGQILSDKPGGRASVGLVAFGAVDVYSVAMDGSEIKLSTLEKGDAFGICNLFAASDLETVLKCREDAMVLFVAKDELIAALACRPEAMLRYARLCNEKIQFLIHRIERLTMQSCRGKLLEYLNAQTDASGMLTLDGPKEQLAKELGVGRASLFRELSQLQSEGLIMSQGNIIFVLDRPALRQQLYTQ